jgi:hypothetical protein
VFGLGGESKVMKIYLRCDETEASCGHEIHISTKDLLLATEPPRCNRCGLDLCTESAFLHAKKKITNPHRLFFVRSILQITHAWARLFRGKQTGGRNHSKWETGSRGLDMLSAPAQNIEMRVRVTDDGRLMRVKE